MLEFQQKYGASVHSQNCEDGLVSEILKRIGLEIGKCAEIGSNDGMWLLNCRALIERGWEAVLVETQFQLWKQAEANWANNPKVKCICSHVDQYNINAFVKDDCDVVSFDTDGGDREIFAGMKAKPKIVIVEIDSSFLPGDYSVNNDGAGGYSPMLDLAIEKGYFLVAHTGNFLLCDNQYRDLFPEIIGDGVSNSELYFNRNWVPAAEVA